MNPSRKHPDCIVDTGNSFDEDGDPSFNPQLPATPASPVARTSPGKKFKSAKKTGCSLKRTLAASSTRFTKARKSATEVVAQPEVLAPSQATAPTPPAVNIAAEQQTTPTVPINGTVIQDSFSHQQQ